LKARNFPFLNHVKYLGVVLDRNIIRRFQTEIIETTAFSLSGVCSLLKTSETMVYPTPRGRLPEVPTLEVKRAEAKDNQVLQNNSDVINA
jgi:hypothetical protein